MEGGRGSGGERFVWGSEGEGEGAARHKRGWGGRRAGRRGMAAGAIRGKQPVDPRALSAEDAALISRDCMRATLTLMGERATPPPPPPPPARAPSPSPPLPAA